VVGRGLDIKNITVVINYDIKATRELKIMCTGLDVRGGLAPKVFHTHFSPMRIQRVRRS